MLWLITVAFLAVLQARAVEFIRQQLNIHHAQGYVWSRGWNTLLL